MLDPQAQARFGPGVSVIVGAAANDGEPFATRAFSVVPVRGDWTRVRVVVAADDPVPVAHLGEGAKVAITGADVVTLRSVQLKGRVALAEATTEEDLDRAMHHASEMARLIEETDGTDRAMVMRLVPFRMVAVEVEVEEHFDQTPGPGAGAPRAVDQ
ncbi:MAG: hypothetical protein U0P45_12530 [Acidimicrobiales bacterium]